jgi:hypothetical protein
LATLQYPADTELGPDLDLVAKRTGPRLQISNRTPRVIRNMQVWLNRQYVREVPLIAIGSENNFRLTRFINRHSEPYPTGTLLAPDESEPLLLVELFDPDAQLRYRVVTWPTDQP